MSIFKSALRIVAAHKLYVIIYLLLLSTFGALIGVANDASASAAVSDARPAVAVIDRDGSSLSEGLKDYCSSVGELEELEDSRRALQDAVAQDRIQYILVIPEGFEDDFARAAASDEAAPTLESVVSYRSASGTLMDVRTSAYLEQAYAYLRTTADSMDEAVSMTNESMREVSRAGLIAADASPLPESLTIYAQFSTYPLIAFTVVAISLFMSALNGRGIRIRSLASPLPSLSRSLQIFFACLVIGLIGWAWICLLGLALFGMGTAPESRPMLVVDAAALLAVALSSSGIGFLLGQIGIGENSANALSNILGMVLTFLGGAWMPMELMPETLVTFARFTPVYWATQAIRGAMYADAVTPETLMPLFGYCGICALFAVAIFLVAIAVGRARSAQA